LDTPVRDWGCGKQNQNAPDDVVGGILVNLQKGARRDSLAAVQL